MEHAANPDLVREARRGDEAAFTALLRPLLDPAFRLAVGMLQDRQLAEDAVQEAAVKAWRRLDRLDEGREIGPWFLGIVANECRTARRASWGRVLKVSSHSQAISSPEETATRGVDLRRALQKLAPDQRLVIVLYFYLDRPFEEIATITGATYAAVRGRFYRGLRELKADYPIAEEP